MSGSGKDQYTSASGVEVPFSEKVADFQAFMKKHGLVMLTTRGPLGALHSRCMAPAETTSDLKMRFIYDRDSYKDKEVENELIPSSFNHVNIAVNGMESNDGWASIAGKAKRIEEEGSVAKLYNPAIKAWFGDLGDGVHDGGPSDPRMAIIEVLPDEIRHYHQARTRVGTAVDVVASAISGNTATPGEVRTITAEDIQAAKSSGELKE